MQWIIPMAGKGKRTKSLGKFKPFIKIAGKEMFSWFLSSIKHSIGKEDTFLLITLEKNFTSNNFKQKTSEIFKKYNIKNKLKYFSVRTTPRGTSETIFLARKMIDKNTTVMVIYPDQYIDFDLSIIKRGNAYLGAYVNFGNRSGFMKIRDGKIIHFVEKTNISNIASSGFYIFPSRKDLQYALKKQIESGETLNGEFYLGPSINYLIKKSINVYPLEVKSKYDLGNPEDIEYFVKNCVGKFN